MIERDTEPEAVVVCWWKRMDNRMTNSPSGYKTGSKIFTISDFDHKVDQQACKGYFDT